MAGRNGSGKRESYPRVGFSAKDERLRAEPTELTDAKMRKSAPESLIHIPRAFDGGQVIEELRAELTRRQNQARSEGDTAAEKRLAEHERRIIGLVDKLINPSFPKKARRPQKDASLFRLENDLRAAISSYNADPAARRLIALIDDPRESRRSGPREAVPQERRRTWADVAPKANAAPSVPKAPVVEATVDDVATRAMLGIEPEVPHPAALSAPKAPRAQPARMPETRKRGPSTEGSEPAPKRKRATRAAIETAAVATPFMNVARERARAIANSEIAPKAARAPAKRPGKEAAVSYNAGEILDGEALARAGEEPVRTEAVEYGLGGIPSAEEIRETVAARKFEKGALSVMPERETPEYKALTDARTALARAQEAEAKEHTWHKRFLSFGGFFGGAKRRQAEGDRNQADAVWKRALAAYANAQLIEEQSKAATWATERWGEGSAKAQKYIEAHKGNVMRRRVLGEMRELNAQRIELMAAREKGLMVQFLDWRRKWPKEVQIGTSALLSATLATGVVAATGGFGGIAATAYGAQRFMRAALGISVGMQAGESVYRASGWFLNIEEKEKGRAGRSLKTRNEIRDRMRNEKPLSVDDAVSLYIATLAKNSKEARREDLIRIVASAGAAVAAGGGTLAAVDMLTSAPLAQPAPSAPTASSIEYVPPAEAPAPELKPLTPQERARLFEVNRAPETVTTPAPTAAPSTPSAPAPQPATPSAPTEVPPAQEPAAPAPAETAPVAPQERASYFAERIAIEKGDTVWGLTELKLANDPRFLALDRAQQDFVLDTMRRDIASLSPEQLKEMGFRGSDINKIYQGDSIDLSRFDRTGLREALYEKSLELTRAEKENILRYRGMSAAEIAAELDQPRTVPQPPASPASSAPSAPAPSVPPEAAPAAPMSPEAQLSSNFDVPPDQASSFPEPLIQDDATGVNLAEAQNDKRPRDPLMLDQDNVSGVDEAVRAQEIEESIFRSPDGTLGDPQRFAAQDDATGVDYATEAARVREVPATPSNQDSPDSYLTAPAQPQASAPQEPAPLPQAREAASQIAQGMDAGAAQARLAERMYAEDLRSMFNVEGNWLSPGEDGLLRFESKLGWKDAATYLRDAAENPRATAEALGLSESEVETLRDFMERARDDYRVPVEGTLRTFMKSAAEAQAYALR